MIVGIIHPKIKIIQIEWAMNAHTLSSLFVLDGNGIHLGRRMNESDLLRSSHQRLDVSLLDTNATGVTRCYFAPLSPLPFICFICSINSNVGRDNNADNTATKKCQLTLKRTFVCMCACHFERIFFLTYVVLIITTLVDNENPCTDIYLANGHWKRTRTHTYTQPKIYIQQYCVIVAVRKCSFCDINQPKITMNKCHVCDTHTHCQFV